MDNVKLRHLKSSTAGLVPASSELLPGQLAVNFADGKLYTKNSLGEVILIASKDAVDQVGTVKSVNGQFPDAEGKVIILPANIGPYGVTPLDGASKVDPVYLPDNYSIPWFEMPENQSLNALSKRGIWYVATLQIAQSGSNYPVVAPGYLTVNSWLTEGQQSTVVAQTYVATNTNVVYIRGLTTNGVWTPWATQLSTKDLGSANMAARLDSSKRLILSQLPNIPIATISANATVGSGVIQRNTYIRSTASSNIIVNIPPTSATVGDEFHFRQAGSGTITFSGNTGVTLNPPFNGSTTTAGIGATVTLKCVATNIFDLFGQVAGL